MHAQAHKLLFWFEIEQFKLLAGDDRVRPSRTANHLGENCRWQNYSQYATGASGESM